MLDENNKKLLESQNQITEQQMKDVMLKQQEINAAIKELQLSLKNEMLQAINTIATTQPQNIPQQMSQNISQVEISKVDQAIPIKIEGDTELKFEEPVIEEPVIEEPIAEEPLMEEPIAEEPLMEEPIGEEPLMEEPIAEEPLMEEPIIEEPIIEEPIIEEAPAEEVPPMPDLSDPNKVMTPEEIAALIANTGAEEPVAEDLVAEEPVAEEPIAEEPIMEEPIMEEAPVEEAPPMPDLSDPNKVMTPDEIAALIANM